MTANIRGMADKKDTDTNRPGLMYYVLMLVAAGCVIYGVYGWVTGKW